MTSKDGREEEGKRGRGEGWKTWETVVSDQSSVDHRIGISTRALSPSLTTQLLASGEGGRCRLGRLENFILFILFIPN